MVPKTQSLREGLGDIFALLDGVPDDDRELLATAHLHEVRFDPKANSVRLLVDLAPAIRENSLREVARAASRMMKGLPVTVERVTASSTPSASIPEHAAAADAGSTTPSANPGPAVGDDIDQSARRLEEAWPSIVAGIVEATPSLAGMLRAARARWLDGAIEIQAASAFFLRRLRESGCEAAIADGLAPLLGSRPAIRFSVGDIPVPEPVAPAAAAPAEPTAKRRESPLIMGTAARLKGTPASLAELNGPVGQILVEGELFGVEWFETRQGKKIWSATLTDHAGAVRMKLFDPEPKLKDALKDGDWIRAGGKLAFDNRNEPELTLTPRDIARAHRPCRKDKAEMKRVELNLHSKFSRLSGLIDLDALWTRLKDWGWDAVCITDDAVVQSFPKAYAGAKKAGIRLGLGAQLNWVDDRRPIASNIPDKAARAAGSLSQAAVVFDLETTGLGAYAHKVIEIAGYRVENGKITAEFKELVDPGEPLSQTTREITKITDEMLTGQPKWPEVFRRFREFVGDAMLVAHNVAFDAGFLRKSWPEGEAMPPLVDTVGMARVVLKDAKNYKLGTLAKALGVNLVDAHRAADDARALARLYILMLEKLRDQGITTIAGLNDLAPQVEPRKIPSQDVVALVRDEGGLRNLYRIVTTAHLDHLFLRPRVPSSFLQSHREGLLVGSGATGGPLVEALLYNEDPKRLRTLAKSFDYIEIAPVSAYAGLLAEGTLRSEDDVRGLIRRIVELADEAGKPVVAVSRAYHLDPHEREYRKLLEVRSADSIPSLHLHTTTEMLEEMAFLGPAAACRVVLDAPREVFGMLGDVPPLPKGFFPPVIDGAEDELRALTLDRMNALYGRNGREVPDLVRAAVEKELNAIIGNGFAVLYLIAQRLVLNSRKNGFVVGSRGSVGSSVVAFLAGITEVNPLPPHYRCTQCGEVSFTDASVKGACGPDLPPRSCCGVEMDRDGYRIPFEAFMGLKGNKVPDIDLNFAGEYQARAMAEIEETFGRDHVFRAGTISTLQQKNAFGFVKKYCEERALTMSPAVMDMHARGITEVARTTGQHPGGMVIIPRHMKVTDILPIQRPADKEAADFITTHFDFHSYEGTVVKVDVLGHDGPTAIRLLTDLTGVDAMNVPVNDPEVLSLFSSTKALGLTESQLGCAVGTLGIPEFGTPLTLDILRETRPTTIEELIRISGVSHGTDVWKGNAQDLIRSGVAKLSEVIATREDIMNELMKKGMEQAKAFAIMESVRKGKGVSAEDEALMRQHRTPAWVIDSCKKIKYMFPKAHAVAYVLMSLRIAWFKVYRPEAYYAAWFTLNIKEFPLEAALGGEKAVGKWLSEVRAKMRERTATPAEESSAVVMELVREMHLRGIEVRPVSLDRSDAQKFRVEDRAIRAPFAAVEGLGEKVASRIADEMNAAPFTTIEDFTARTGVSRTIAERLRKLGAFGALPESDQLALF